MGLFLGRDKKNTKAEKAAQEAAFGDPQKVDEDMVTKFIQQLLEVGIDGRGPLKSAVQLADKARAKHKNTEDAVDEVAGDALKALAAGGFVTGLGGFITLPVALPANILEFYVLAARMTASIAHLRGYDTSKPEVRSAILLTLTGSKAEEVLQKAGVGGAVSGRVTNLALGKLPAAALMMVNKGVGFQILRSTASKTLAKLGKGVPVVGGVIGGGMDGWMGKRIADAARESFPQR
ncbi:EcsC family protein [Aestuariimicrobium sp. p3-SID1156]|uniref:EcsC family protein n=1 Tax=Aestuariimicrobium sp. p3-SID1156 TaxID=2916038 RepID=UPI00223B38E9|nr:EcsC family protein [Aestuariimicrobium sp. p3-SID1156]MCT1458202.1 EcsC family protein [Aestuariimicrobium sp. p3-SID1156]